MIFVVKGLVLISTSALAIWFIHPFGAFFDTLRQVQACHDGHYSRCFFGWLFKENHRAVILWCDPFPLASQYSHVSYMVSLSWNRTLKRQHWSEASGSLHSIDVHVLSPFAMKPQLDCSVKAMYVHVQTHMSYFLVLPNVELSLFD